MGNVHKSEITDTKRVNTSGEVGRISRVKRPQLTHRLRTKCMQKLGEGINTRLVRLYVRRLYTGCTHQEIVESIKKKV